MPDEPDKLFRGEAEEDSSTGVHPKGGPHSEKPDSEKPESETPDSENERPTVNPPFDPAAFAKATYKPTPKGTAKVAPPPPNDEPDAEGKEPQGQGMSA